MTFTGNLIYISFQLHFYHIPFSFFMCLKLRWLTVWLYSLLCMNVFPHIFFILFVYQFPIIWFFKFIWMLYVTKFRCNHILNGVQCILVYWEPLMYRLLSTVYTCAYSKWACTLREKERETGNFNEFTKPDNCKIQLLEFRLYNTYFIPLFSLLNNNKKKTTQTA